MVNLECGDDIQLKQMEPSDATPLFQCVDSCRSYLKQFLGWVDLTTSINDVEGFIQMAQDQWTSGTAYVMAMLHKGKHVGVCGFNLIDKKNQIGFIGYWITEKAQGKGITKKACQSLVHFGFKELQLNRIVIQCATSNLKSQAIPRSLGFTQEGILRQAEKIGAHFNDLVVFARLWSEYR